MATNRRDLKAFVRYDGSGRVVSDSLVLRAKKPTVGVWTEVRGYQCCNCPEVYISVITETLPYTTGLAFELYCQDSQSYNYIAILGTYATLEEMVSALNQKAPYIGDFAVGTDGQSIMLNPNADICKSITPCESGMVGHIYPYTMTPT